MKMNIKMSSSEDQEMEELLEMKPAETIIPGFIYPEVVAEPSLGSDPDPVLTYSDEVTCNWTATLPKIDLFNPVREGPHLISSPVFHLGNNINSPTQWRIQLSHNIWYDYKERTIALYLWRLDPRNLKTSEACQHNWRGVPIVHYSFDILDQDGNVAFTKENALTHMRINTASGWRNFAKYREVEGCIVQDRIKVRIVLKIMKLHENVDEQPDVEINIYNSKGFVTKVSRNLLRSKSSRFHSMIGNSDLTNVQLGDGAATERHFIRALVEFMQKGSCTLLQRKDIGLDSSIPEKISLYRIGKEYEVFGIEAACYKSMVRISLNLSGFVEIAIFSKIHGIKDRAEFAEDFNHLKKYFLENREAIKQLSKFKSASIMYGAYFVELLLGPPAPLPPGGIKQTFNLLSEKSIPTQYSYIN